MEHARFLNLSAVKNPSTFPWPEISDRIQWNEQLLIPLDIVPGTVQYCDSRTQTIPAWLKDSSAIGFGKDLAALKVRVIEQAVELSEFRNHN